MPNFQQWLNAWVKVNHKQSLTAPPELNGARASSGRSQSWKDQSNRVAASSQSANMAIKGNKVERAPTANGSGAVAHGIDRVWKQEEALVETERSSQVASVHQFSTIGHGSLDNTVATSTEPIADIDPELEAIRRHTNRKHKRRLQRTSSFSDLIREEAKHQVLRSNGIHVERQPHPASGGSRECWRRHSHSHNQAGHRLQHPPKAFPPPPTLHHSFVAPEQSLELASSSKFSNGQSISPAETATTVQQSNVQQQMYHRSYSDGGQYSDIDHSNSALIGVAEFFGTELEDQQIRISTTANATQHQTHAAQHGSEEEQPSYFQSYLHDNRRLHTAHNNNNTSNSRLHHSHYRNNTRQAVHHTLISPRPSNQVNPPLPAYRRSQTAPSSSVPAMRAKPPLADHQTEDLDPGLLLAGVRLPFFPKNHAGESTLVHAEHTDGASKPFGVGEPNCKGCLVAQAELQCAQESLEYMRSMAIRKEYTCSKCNSNNTSCDSATRKVASPTVKSSSQQMSEVTARHKKQVEQLLKERNNWQRKMHMKLDKVSNLAQNLNNESSFRVEESKSLRDELKEVKMERDRMAAELEQLRTAVEVHEKEQEEHRRVQEKMTKYESIGLRQAHDMIAKLTERLGATLDTLALEREQQRQRRQIIFPPNTSQGRPTVQMNGHANMRHETHKASSGQPISKSNDSSNEELKLLRSQLLESQQLLEATQREAKQNEAHLIHRCEALEIQLEKEKRAKEPESKILQKERHPLSEQNEAEEEFS